MTKAKTLATLVSNNNPLADGTLSVGDVTGLQAELDAKQAALVSGTSIKTVNGTSLLGSGNIQIDGGVVSFNTRTGSVTLSSGDVTGALGYTPATSGDISSAISALVDTAPATLDTLNELAAALGDDPNFATTVTTLIGTKQDSLISGTNIKTINSQSILGSGNLQLGAAGGGTDQVFYLNDQTVTTNYTIPVGKNAMTTGPVAVADGVTVTVSDGSRWAIL